MMYMCMLYEIYDTYYFFHHLLPKCDCPVWTPCGYVTRAPSPRGEGVGGACSRRKPKERGPGGAVCQTVSPLVGVLLKGPTR